MDNYEDYEDLRMPVKYNYMDMYAMAANNRICGYKYWPAKGYALKSFQLIENRLMTENEEPVFCFMARIKHDGIKEMSYDKPTQSYQNDRNISQSDQGNLFTMMFSWLIMPFDMSYQWAAFVLTNKNNLYVAHYSWPFKYASDMGTIKLLPNDIQMTQDNFKYAPGWGTLTFSSLRGENSLTILWKSRYLNKIYHGVSNNIDRNGKKYEDEDGLIMY